MSFLTFLNLIDENKKLSITNIAVIIILIKLITVPAISITEVGTLFLALVNYSAKKIINNQKQNAVNPLQEQVSSFEEKLSDITSQVSALAIKQGLKS